MKIETKETVVTNIVGYLTIEEGRLINNILEKSLESLNCCGAFSYEDLKSYNKTYSPEAINYYVINDGDDEDILLGRALSFLTKFTNFDMLLGHTEQMYENICDYKDIENLSVEDMKQLIDVKKSSEMIKDMIENKVTELTVVREENK